MLNVSVTIGPNNRLQYFKESPEKSTSSSLIGLIIASSISLQVVEIMGSNHVLTAHSWNAL